MLNFQAWLEKNAIIFRAFYFNANEISNDVKSLRGRDRPPCAGLCLPVASSLPSCLWIMAAPQCTLQSPAVSPAPGPVPKLLVRASVKAWIMQPRGCRQNLNEACLRQEASPALQLQNKPPWRQAIIHLLLTLSNHTGGCKGVWDGEVWARNAGSQREAVVFSWKGKLPFGAFNCSCKIHWFGSEFSNWGRI